MLGENINGRRVFTDAWHLHLKMSSFFNWIACRLNSISQFAHSRTPEYSCAAGADIRKFHRIFIGLSVTGIVLLISQSIWVEKSYCKNVISISLSEQNESVDPKIQELITALHEGDSDERQRAAIALSTSRDPSAVEPLIKALEDKDDFVRDFAVRALGNFRDPRAVEPLVKSLDDKSILVQRSAARALGSIGDPRAVEPLIKAMNNNDILVRRSAARALGTLHDPRAIDPLIKVLADDDIYISNAAAIALGDIGSAAIPRLVDTLADWTIGPRSAEVLKGLNWQPSSDVDKIRFDVAQRNKQALLDNWDVAQKVLMNDANSENIHQVQNAAFALIAIGRDEVVSELVRILHEKGNEKMAKAYSDCGNASLAEAARDWAKNHGEDLDKAQNEGVDVEWGKMSSSQIADGTINSL